MLSEDVHAQVQALAECHQVSSAWVIRTAVQYFLNEYRGQRALPLMLPQGRESSYEQ